MLCNTLDGGTVCRVHCSSAVGVSRFPPCNIKACVVAHDNHVSNDNNNNINMPMT